MATFPTPHTWTAGDDATSGNMQSLTTAINFLAAPPRAKAYRSAALSIADNSDAIIAFDAEDHDTDGIHSNVSSNSKMIAVTAGRYRVWGQVAFANDVDGYRSVQILKNGVVTAQTRGKSADASVGSYHQVYDEVLLGVGDYVELQVHHAAGASLALAVGAANSTFLAVAWASTT